MWNIGTTFDYNGKKDYKYALTHAKPDDGWLWFRLPESLKDSISDGNLKKLEWKIKEALVSDRPKELVKEVFVELWLTLETGFTKKQIETVVWNLDNFSDDLIVPIEELSENTYLLNESYWPTDAFKDLALQMLTEMTSTIVSEQNMVAIEKAKNWEKWQILRFLVNLTSTSWDTGPAWWAWIEGKNFIVNVIWFPANESTFSQVWQMVTLKDNILALPMNESFSNIQSSMISGNTDEYKKELENIIKEEMSDLVDRYGFEIEVSSGSFNSINPGRIDGQMIYHTYWLLQAKAKKIIKEWEDIIEVIPSGNGWHVYGALQARLLWKVNGPTVVTCNENDMFYKIFEEWRFQKETWKSIHQASVSMIIEYPNNMIRLFSYAFWPKRAKDISDEFFSGKEVIFTNEERDTLKNKLNIHWYRITSEDELTMVQKVFKKSWRLICPHTANAVKWLEEYRDEYGDDITPALVSETASPWKFLAATAAALECKISTLSLYNHYRKLERTQEWCLELIEKIKYQYNIYWYKFNDSLIPKDLQDIYLKGYKSRETISADSFHDETLKFLKGYAPEFRKQVLELLK